MTEKHGISMEKHGIFWESIELTQESAQKDAETDLAHLCAHQVLSGVD